MQKDILSIVNNVQQVSPEELAASRNVKDTSTRFVIAVSIDCSYITSNINAIAAQIRLYAMVNMHFEVLHCVHSFPNCRILEIVEVVLDVVEVAPDKPFEFADTQFGVRVEDPPEDLGEEESFMPNITALLSEIRSNSNGSMKMEQMLPEVPPAQVALSSTLLRPKGNSSQLRVSTTVFVTDRLFQQRDAFTEKSNLTNQFVGSIILDISVRLDGKVLNVEQSFNSNIVQPEFTKTSVSVLIHCSRISEWCMVFLYRNNQNKIKPVRYICMHTKLAFHSTALEWQYLHAYYV